MSANIASVQVDDDERRRTTAECLAAARRASPRDRHELLDRVVLANLPVARSVAAQYRGRGVPAEDLEQVAYLGLVRAVHQFDPELGHDFLSYAVPTMRGAVRRHFRDHGWVVRPPRRIQELQTRALDAAAALEEVRGGEADAAAVARVIDEPVEAVDEALAARGCFAPSSLDLPRGDDGGSLGEMLADADATDLAAAEARVTLRPAVRSLSARDRTIVYLRFFEGCTQQEIADRLGTSQMQISRLLTRILASLRRQVGDDLDGHVEHRLTAGR